MLRLNRMLWYRDNAAAGQRRHCEQGVNQSFQNSWDDEFLL